MTDVIIGLIGAVIGSAGAIIGVVIGAKMSEEVEEKKYRRQALVDAYTNFFSSVYLFISKRTDDTLHQVLTASEHDKLLCSAEISDEIDDMIDTLISDEAENVGKGIEQLRLQARKDIENR